MANKLIQLKDGNDNVFPKNGVRTQFLDSYNICHYTDFIVEIELQRTGKVFGDGIETFFDWVLPSEARPSSVRHFTIWGRGTRLEVVVYADGRVSLVPIGTTLQDVWIYTSIMFFK